MVSMADRLVCSLSDEPEIEKTSLREHPARALLVGHKQMTQIQPKTLTEHSLVN